MQAEVQNPVRLTCAGSFDMKVVLGGVQKYDGAVKRNSLHEVKNEEFSIFPKQYYRAFLDVFGSLRHHFCAFRRAAAQSKSCYYAIWCEALSLTAQMQVARCKSHSVDKEIF